MSFVIDPLSRSAHPLEGSLLRGTYEVQRVIDRGGMGIVFEAEQVRLQRKVAIKVLPLHLAQDQQALLRFRREAELVSLLQHPNVVQIVDFDSTEQGEPYIVMEFLAGESLELRLARQPVLPLEFAVRVATQVASALAAVHAAQIVHRDLKPANIFLTELPENGVHVKLLDFGLGKRLGGHQRLTGEHDVLGTPDYMPPEQAQGKTAYVDQRGDQYSLATIVYEMLAGRGPFLGDMMDVLAQVITSEAPRIEDLVPNLPVGIGSVLRRAMQKEPAERFPAIAEFAVALSAAAATPVTTPEPASLTARANTTLRLTSDPSVLALARRHAAAASAEPARGVISTTPGPPSQDRLLGALDAAKKARSARDIDLAAAMVERALSIADALSNGVALATLEREEALIEGLLEMRIGPRDHALRVQPPAAGEYPSLLPEEAFLLSRIDGVATTEEVLDLSPLPRVRTLRLLVRLLRRRLITNE